MIHITMASFSEAPFPLPILPYIIKARIDPNPNSKVHRIDPNPNSKVHHYISIYGYVYVIDLLFS